MRKVTERLLVACVAALAVAACQDSVIVTEPAPPPPPPSGPDATVTIQGLRSIPGNAPVNPTAVAGDINVVLNVEEGDNTVTGISLLLDGTEIACQGISANEGPAGAPRLSGSADVVECFFNSDDVAGACVGEQLDPAYPNGAHTLGARITLDDGSTRDASNEQQITIVNTSFLLVAVVSEPDPVVGTSGVLYHGGGDIEFGVCPVSYNNTVVAAVSLVGASAGAAASCDQDQGGAVFGACGDVDVGAGAGAAATDNSAPFVFTAAASQNDGFDSGAGDAGTGVEDLPILPVTTGGHTITTTGQVIADDGSNVTTEFTGGSLANFYMDFVAPRVNCSAGCAGFAASEVTIDEPAAGSSTANTWYSEGNFGLSNVEEDGVGWSFGAGATLDVGNCATAANNDAQDATDFVPLFSDVGSIDDVDEDDWEQGGDGFGGTDGGGTDCYLAELRALADALANASRLADPGSIPNQIQTLNAFGKDATAADLSAPQPDPATQPFVLNPDPDNDGVADPGDWTLMFDGADPDLASGDPGSTVDETGCLAGGPCTNITADVDGPTGSPSSTAVDNGNTNSTDKGGTDDDFIVDIGFTDAPPGSNWPDGDYEITVTVPDFAVPANDAELVFTFTLDNTPPSFGALNPVPGGSAGTTATSIIQSIGGTITDVHEIATATLTVFADGSDAVGTGGDGACTTGDYKLSVSGNEIDQNDVDIASGTNNISFNESFEIFEPTSASATVTYCFIIVAEDNATDKTGAAAGNVSSLETQADVNWLP